MIELLPDSPKKIIRSIHVPNNGHSLERPKSFAQRHNNLANPNTSPTQQNLTPNSPSTPLHITTSSINLNTGESDGSPSIPKSPTLAPGGLHRMFRSNTSLNERSSRSYLNEGRLRSAKSEHNVHFPNQLLKRHHLSSCGSLSNASSIEELSQKCSPKIIYDRTSRTYVSPAEGLRRGILDMPTFHRLRKAAREASAGVSPGSGLDESGMSRKSKYFVSNEEEPGGTTRTYIKQNSPSANPQRGKMLINHPVDNKVLDLSDALKQGLIDENAYKMLRKQEMEGFTNLQSKPLLDIQITLPSTGEKVHIEDALHQGAISKERYNEILRFLGERNITKESTVTLNFPHK